MHDKGFLQFQTFSRRRPSTFHLLRLPLILAATSSEVRLRAPNALYFSFSPFVCHEIKKCSGTRRRNDAVILAEHSRNRSVKILRVTRSVVVSRRRAAAHNEFQSAFRPVQVRRVQRLPKMRTSLVRKNKCWRTLTCFTSFIRFRKY